MGKTKRKGRNGKSFRESLKKRDAPYECRCEYCMSYSRDAKIEKILDFEIKKCLNNFDM